MEKHENIILGLDYGHRWVGTAIGNTITQDARALTTIQNTGKQLFIGIANLLRFWETEHLVIGRPQYADQRPHPVALAAEHFALQLQQYHPCVVYWVNEAYSSVCARLERFGTSKKTIRDDAEAARIILQQFLNSE